MHLDSWASLISKGSSILVCRINVSLPENVILPAKYCMDPGRWIAIMAVQFLRVRQSFVKVPCKSTYLKIDVPPHMKSYFKFLISHFIFRRAVCLVHILVMCCRLMTSAVGRTYPFIISGEKGTVDISPKYKFMDTAEKIMRSLKIRSHMNGCLLTENQRFVDSFFLFIKKYVNF